MKVFSFWNNNSPGKRRVAPTPNDDDKDKPNDDSTEANDSAEDKPNDDDDEDNPNDDDIQDNPNNDQDESNDDQDNPIKVARHSRIVIFFTSCSSRYEGSFTDSDVEKFQNYISETDSLGVLFSCLKPLMIMIIFVLPLYLIPLPPVSSGYGIELTALNICCSIIGNLILVLLMEHFFPQLNLQGKATYCRRVILSIIGGIIYTLTVGVLTISFCNPFPFVLIVSVNTCIPVVISLCYVMYLVPLREEKIIPQKEFQESKIAFCYTLFCFWCLMVAYPGFLHLFYSLAPENPPLYYQLLFMVLLFFLRLTLKRMLVMACQKGNRPAPVLTAIMVSGYHVMYLSITLQSKDKGDSYFSLASVFVLDIINHTKDFIKINRLRHSQSEGPVQLSWSFNEKTTKKEQEIKKIVLPESEALVLVEYVECIVPIIMATFLSIITTFDWNKKYFTFYKDMDADAAYDAGLMLIVFFLLEATMMLLIVKLTRKVIGIPMEYLLGYTLDKNLTLVLTLTSTFYLYALGGGLDHMHSEWSFSCDTPPPFF